MNLHIVACMLNMAMDVNLKVVRTPLIMPFEQINASTIKNRIQNNHVVVDNRTRLHHRILFNSDKMIFLAKHNL